MKVIMMPLGLFCLLAILACSKAEYSDTLERNKTDRNGLVEFGVASGWNNEGSNSGRHFSRDNPEEDQGIIYIDALDRPASLEIDFIWEQTKGKHEIQEHVLQRENAGTLNGFTLREAVYEAEVRGQPGVYHDIFLFADNLQVHMSLNAHAQVYEGYVDDFRAMVGSVRAAGAGE